MTDRVPNYPGRVKLVPVSGQTNTYDMTMADDPGQAGTALNKANLLTDATAALIAALTGTTPDTPNEALAELANGFGGAVIFETNTYSGGNSNAVSIVFDQQPDLVYVWGGGDTTAVMTGLIHTGSGSCPIYSSVYSSTTFLTYSWTGTTLSWVGTDAPRSLNSSGQTYTYIGLRLGA